MVGGRERRNWVEEKRWEAEPPGKSARAEPTSGLRGKRKKVGSARRRRRGERGGRKRKKDATNRKIESPANTQSPIWIPMESGV